MRIQILVRNCVAFGVEIDFLKRKVCAIYGHLISQPSHSLPPLLSPSSPSLSQAFFPSATPWKCHLRQQAKQFRLVPPRQCDEATVRHGDTATDWQKCLQFEIKFFASGLPNKQFLVWERSERNKRFPLHPFLSSSPSPSHSFSLLLSFTLCLYAYFPIVVFTCKQEAPHTHTHTCKDTLIHA